MLIGRAVKESVNLARLNRIYKGKLYSLTSGNIYLDILYKKIEKN